MQIFERQTKKNRGSGNYFFGDYGEIPIGISQIRINEAESQNFIDPVHFHKMGTEYYLTIEGTGVIEIEGQEVELNEKQMVMVEPGEKHAVKRIFKTPLTIICFCTTKDPNDKVTV